jgi:hypothetical protein
MIRNYLLFTGVSFLIAGIKFFTFLTLEPQIFVDGLSKIGIITLGSGILGMFLDQGTAKLIPSKIIGTLKFYGINLVVGSFLFIIINSLIFNLNSIYILAQILSMATCLLARGICAGNEKKIAHQIFSITYGFYIYLLTLSHTLFNEHIFLITIVLNALAVIELMYSANNKKINYSKNNIIISINKIKFHFTGYFLVFISLKLIEYGDKIYCDAFSCTETTINLVKVSTLVFTASSMCWAIIINNQLINNKKFKYEKLIAIILSIPIHLVIIQQCIPSLNIFEIFIIVFLILCSHICQELRIKEINYISLNNPNSNSFGYASSIAMLVGVAIILIGYPYFSNIVYLLVRYKLLTKLL